MERKLYDIIPFVSIGDILFTDDRATIRAKIGGKSKDGIYEIGNITELYDYFVDNDIKALYDKEERLGALEFYSGHLSFLNKDLFSLSYEDVQSFFLDIDQELEIIDMGFTSYKYGIGVGYEEETQPPISIIIFKSGYYG